MAGEVHGSQTRVHFVGYDLSPYLKSATIEETVDTADVTAFTDLAKRYIVGQEDGSFTADGNYVSTQGAVRDALEAAAGVKDALLTVYPEGDALGKPAAGLGGIESTRSIQTPIADAVMVSMALQSSIGVEDLVSLHAMGVVDHTNGLPGWDNGVSTPDGLVAHLQCRTVNGGGAATIRIQDSVDGVTWVDKITFAPVAARSYQRLVIAGTINRHLRARVTPLTATSVQFAVSAGRKPINP